MRKITTIVAALFMTVATFAQAPQGFSYQAVVRDAQNAIVANQEVDVDITITAEVDGTAVQTYTEKHSVTTNANGLFTLVVGQGESSQKLSDIKWSVPGAIYNMRTETKYGTATTQLLSVPFAMYAEQAGELDYQKLAKTLNSSDVQALLGYVKAEDLEAIRKYINDSLAAYGNTYVKKTDVNVMTNNYVTKEVFENYVISGGNPDSVDLSVYAKKTDIPAAPDLSNYVNRGDLNMSLSFISDTINYIRGTYAPKDFVSKNYVTKEAFDNYVLSGGQADSVDLTVYAKTADVEKTYAKKSDIPSLSGYAKTTDIPTVPTKVSDLQNDENYLKEHQDITGKQDVITDLEEIRSGAAKGATALQSHQSLAAYTTTAKLKDTLDVYSTTAKLNDTLAHYTPTANLALVATTGNYNNLSNRPVNVSTFVNDQNYVTQAYLESQHYVSASETGNGSLNFELNDFYTKAEVEALIDDFKEKLLAGKLTKKENPEIGGEHDFVDLGLPSGTLWAKCNLGATEPYETGGLVQYNATEIHDWCEYSTTSGSVYATTFTTEAYNNATKGDAASANWGGQWTVPTNDQFQELLDNCYIVNVTQYEGNTPQYSKGKIFYKALRDSDRGVSVNEASAYSGYNTTSVPHIFIPSAVSRTPYYSYWASDITNIFDGSKLTSVSSMKKCGFSVRPVHSNTIPATVSDVCTLQQQLASLQAMLPKMATVNVTVNYDAGDSDMAYISMFGEKITGTKTFKAPLGYALLWKFEFGTTKSCSGNPYTYCSVAVNGKTIVNPEWKSRESVLKKTNNTSSVKWDNGPELGIWVNWSDRMYPSETSNDVLYDAYIGRKGTDGTMSGRLLTVDVPTYTLDGKDVYLYEQHNDSYFEPKYYIYSAKIREQPYSIAIDEETINIVITVHAEYKVN